MSKMHSSGRGMAKSIKPYATQFPTWLETPVDEIKQDIIKLSSKGVKPSIIGNKLRDVYCVGNAPDILDGLSLTRFLEKSGNFIEIPEELQNLVERANILAKHINQNRRDTDAKFRRNNILAKIKRCLKHNKLKGRIPGNWAPKLININK